MTNRMRMRGRWVIRTTTAGQGRARNFALGRLLGLFIGASLLASFTLEIFPIEWGAPPGVAEASVEATVDITEAVRVCGPQESQQKISCYLGHLLAIQSRSGVEYALASLATIGVSDQDVQREGHLYAHAIGIAAYQAHPDVADTFARCSALYQSGCYHGVIQAYLDHTLNRIEADRASTIQTVCEAYRAERTRWLLFQCLHAVGHGLTVLYDHDLPQALLACDVLGTEWDRRSCYGGVFMENVVHATAPQAHIGSPRGLQHTRLPTTTGRDHEEASQAPAFKAVDPQDWLYPCSILAERYLVDCYLMQTSVILYHTGWDFALAARTCDRAPESVRRWCYQSLGRDISSYTLQDPEHSRRLCSLGMPQYQPWCYVGAVKHFIDVTSKADGGFAFCRRALGLANKIKCYEAVGEQLWALGKTSEEKIAECEQAEPDFREVCHYGSRIGSLPPLWKELID